MCFNIADPDRGADVWHLASLSAALQTEQGGVSLYGCIYRRTVSEYRIAVAVA